MKRVTIVFISIMLLGTFLWQCEQRIAPISSAMKKELSRLPESAIGMTYVNVNKIKESEFFSIFEEKFKMELNEDDEYQDFAGATGFDFTTDVDEMYVAFAPGESRDKKQFLAVIKGNFDEGKIIDFISNQDMRHELKSQQYQDYKIYRIEDKPVRFVFPDANTLIVGVEHYVTTWLNGDENAEKWVNRMEKMRYKDGVCFTMDAKSMINDIMLELDEWEDGKKLQALRSVEDVYFSMEATDVILFDGKGKFSDTQNAELFKDAIKGVLATVKISVSGDRDAVDVFNKIRIDQDGNWVTGHFKMSKEDIEKLMKTHPHEVVL
jgi:hypothetical protein